MYNKYSAARRPLSAVLALLLCLSGTAQLHAATGTTITPNYKDADIRQVIEAVGEVTGKNFILDPRVKAQVTMLSVAPMSPPPSRPPPAQMLVKARGQ